MQLYRGGHNDFCLKELENVCVTVSTGHSVSVPALLNFPSFMNRVPQLLRSVVFNFFLNDPLLAGNGPIPFRFVVWVYSCNQFMYILGYGHLLG